MKKTVKILALLMALLMMATVFTGCNQKSEEKDDKEEKTEVTEKKEDKKDTTEEDKKAVEKVIEDYTDALLKEVDEPGEILENVEDYLEPDSDVYEEMEENVKGIEENALIRDWNAINTVKEVEIGEIEIDGDEATAEVKFTSCDQESYEEIKNDMIIEAVDEWLGENYDATYDEFLEQDEEIQAAVEEEFLAEIDFSEIYYEAAKEATKVTKDQKVTLKKIDGKWLISETK